MQKRGVQVSDVNGVPDDVVTEIVGFTVDDSAFDTAACHPMREAFRMVVAPIIITAEFALAINRASEFATPGD